MRCRLLDPDGGFFPRPLPLAAELERDLGLELVYQAMAAGDKRRAAVVREVLLNQPLSGEEIRYRQANLREALARRELVTDLHRLAAEALEAERHLFPAGRSASSILRRSRDAMKLFLDYLKRLRERLERERDLSSPGFAALAAEARKELDDAFFREAAAELQGLDTEGYLFKSRLGPGLKPEPYGLALQQKKPLWKRLVARERGYAFHLDPRDEAGSRMLADLQEAGLLPVSRALAQASGHVLTFFADLHYQTSFLLGALQLYDRLAARGAPRAFPEIAESEEGALSFDDLRELVLLLTQEEEVVGNRLEADGKRLLVVSGPNRGGKTTFLRSLGLALLFMGAGLFVPAAGFRASPPTGVFTHFKREEAGERGRLDEELARLAAIVEHVQPGAWLLMNESFSSTYEHEGTALAEEALRALVEDGVRVVFVTHMAQFVRDVENGGWPGSLLLKAERTAGGERTFRIVPGVGIEGHALDLYQRLLEGGGR